MASEIKLGAGNPTIIKQNVCRVFQDIGIWLHKEDSILPDGISQG
jgi:hypothetical protein